MSENCTHNCSTCGESCSSRTAEQTSFLEPLNPASSVKKVIGVVSGKGGVGKSLVTAMMAVKMNSKGKHTAILDADITGPSIPKAFGLNNNMVMMTKDNLMIPATSALGIDIMSANLLLDNDTDPVIWRGPVIAGAVKQFWNETLWEDVDYMFVDMPPGTGAGFHDRGKGCEDGTEDEHSDHRSGREHELPGVPGLRQEDFCIW